MRRKYRLIGRCVVKPVPGVADYDGTAEMYGREKQVGLVAGVQYTLGESFILASIKQIREKYPDRSDRLYQFEQLMYYAEKAELKGRDLDAIADIRQAIDEIKSSIDR